MMSRSGYRLGALVLLASVVTPTAWATVIPPTLVGLVEKADLILVGRDEEVLQHEGWQIARFSVDRRLKGEAGDFVYYLAEKTWTCDVAAARPGESVVLFLSSPPEDWSPYGLFKLDPPSSLGPEAIRVVTWAGLGRLPIRSVNGSPEPQIDLRGIEMPAGAPALAGLKLPQDLRRLSLERVVWLILDEVLAQEMAEPKAVHAASPR